jgi:hypothetical protein
LKLSLQTILGFAAALGWTALAAAPVRADNPADYLHTRTYVGFSGISVGVDTGGAFSGTNYSRVDDPYEIDLIPALSRNIGFGVLVGHREEAWAFELSFWQTDHTATFGPATLSSPVTTGVAVPKTQGEAVYDSINLDFKRYFLTEMQIQPFISLGVCFPWIVVQNAASDGSGPASALTLAGLGLNLGIGAEYYFSPNVSVTAGAYQRWASFDQFKGVALQFSQLNQYGANTSDEGSGLNFAVGATLGFE